MFETIKVQTRFGFVIDTTIEILALNQCNRKGGLNAAHHSPNSNMLLRIGTMVFNVNGGNDSISRDRPRLVKKRG